MGATDSILLMSEIKPAKSGRLRVQRGEANQLGRMCMRRSSLAVLATAVAVSAVAAPALAQKSGGILKGYHRGNPPSGSPHEEATISTVMQYMSVFNNLVMFDPAKRIESAETLVPDLATSWKWDASKTKLTFQLRSGVKWHDGKPFTAKDVKCTFDLLQGKSKSRLRKNPRSIW